MSRVPFRTRLFSILGLLVAGGLCGCASVAPPAPDATLLSDERFAAPTQRANADDLFTLSEPMREFLRTEVHGPARRIGSAQALINALNDRGRLRLTYDETFTRTAAQAFEARAGNCLSLLVMTAAFARELGLQVQYHSAYIEDTWSRAGNLHVANGHVNVTLTRRRTDLNGGRIGNVHVVDFLPPGEVAGLRSQVIDEATVVAMYMNNRATEALVRGETHNAYWWARGAILASPSLNNAYNTLGVVYQRHGDLDLAARVFDRVLGAEPTHAHALHNQAQVLDRLGREQESARLRERLARVERQSPFHFLELGLHAMQRGEYAAARDLLLREAERTGQNHEVHFWLGVAHWRLGAVDAARRHLTLAHDHSPTPGDRDRYAGKLQTLRTSAVQ